jgi:hypothetical protein
VEPKATAGSQGKGSVDRSATIVQMIWALAFVIKAMHDHDRNALTSTEIRRHSSISYHPYLWENLCEPALPWKLN